MLEQFFQDSTWWYHYFAMQWLNYKRTITITNTKHKHDKL